MRERGMRRHSPHEIREYVPAYLMILISMVGMAVFVLAPIAWVLRWCRFSCDELTDGRYVGRGTSFGHSRAMQPSG